MQTIVVVYHHEAGTWWAESDDAPGFSASANTLAETRVLVHEGVPFHLDVPAAELELFETTDRGTVVFDYTITAPAAAATQTNDACAAVSVHVEATSRGLANFVGHRQTEAAVVQYLPA